MSGVMDAEPRAAAQVLLVEDDDAVRRSLHLFLNGCGYQVKSYARVAALSNDPKATDADYLVVDYRLSDGDGLGVLRGLRRSGWQGRAIMVTGYPSDALHHAALAGGFAAVIEKPLRLAHLLAQMEGH